MPVLVTGAGLVGSQVARLLADRGEVPILLELRPQREALQQIVDLKKVRLVEGDVLDLEGLKELVKREGIDAIVHTAANPMLTVGAQEEPYDAIRLNIMGTVNVLEVGRQLGLRRIVFCSSSVLYTYRREAGEVGQREDNYPRPTTIYASTKLACENIGLNYAEHYGLDFLALRFKAVFGPWSGRGGGGPSMMFRRLVEGALKGEEVSISPRVMEFVYSKDAARGVILALEAREPKGRIYNVGMGRIYTPEEIARLLRDRVPQAKIKVEDLPIGRPEIRDEPMDLSRSRRELGYEPHYDMPQALDDYISWYRELGLPR